MTQDNTTTQPTTNPAPTSTPVGDSSDSTGVDAVKEAQWELMVAMGIDKIAQKDEKRAEELMISVGDTIQQRTVMHIIETDVLDESLEKQLVKMLKDKDTTQEAAQDFLDQNIPTLNQIMVEKIKEYKKEVDEFFQALMNFSEEDSTVALKAA